ncbi:hypothetical protein EC973_005778 [Apophysomyces ossiformis]|uniref:HCP-like protein n=1 Tax=Apophysomyces ossiformis TaxID=679940 RepID=A0A8H7BER1_9FUNG|nr:hypothetical protein EC973_005778 [Apophysomyces ossiformis]
MITVPRHDAHYYDTFYGRESLVDPITVERPTGVSRETYIEPNVSTMVHTTVTPQSIYGAEYLIPDHATSPSNELADPQIRTMSPPTPVKSRLQHFQWPVQVQHASVVEFKPAVATMMGSIESLASPSSANRKGPPSPINPSVATFGNTNTIASQALYTRRDPPVSPMYPTSAGAAMGSTESFMLQSPPNKKNPAQPTKSTSSRQHPQPLPPLVIPPTPVRSVSTPNRHVVTPNQRSSSIQQDSPFLTPSSMTPASSRSGAASPSPLTVSPRTPSPNTLMPSTSSPLSPVKQEKAQANKKQSFVPDSQAEALVHKGIKFHETGQLEKATDLFRQAAIKDFPMGMFLYGVSLRHGWGCKRNEHLAFQYLQKAAEHAVMDLNNFSSAVNTSASKGELIMAIYELGVSFRHGWGCKKNKETAVYFFKIAADLGDADAQNDLGHCYYHGHGVKKDLYMAAKYYRMAEKQGHSIMGNSWIHKSKYDKPK